MKKPEVKILFLDFDGVLNSNRSILVYNNTNFDPIAVGLLRKFVIENNVKIVITSSWRYTNSLQEMRDMFNVDFSWFDADELIIDVTGEEETTRGWQIDSWVYRYESQNKSHVRLAILDDRDDMEPYMHRLVRTEMDDGLLVSHYKKLENLIGE